MLLYDIGSRGVPQYILSFVNRRLEGYRTKLKFDSCESTPFVVRSGIPQGNSMSLVLYWFYGWASGRCPKMVRNVRSVLSTPASWPRLVMALLRAASTPNLSNHLVLATYHCDAVAQVVLEHLTAFR